MDRFHAMQVFIEVAENKSFAAAARKLHSSAPTVTRIIAEFENHLGVILFHRTTRQIRLTEAGMAFFEDCQHILSLLNEAEESVTNAYQVPKGNLYITASMGFGTMYIAPLLFEFLKQYPEISIKTLFVDRVVDFFEEGLDVAIRIGKLSDSSLTAIPVGHVRRVICAAPAYLEKHGIPQTPHDLQQHEAILFSSLTPQAQWQFEHSHKLFTVPVSSRLTTNTAEVAIAAAVAGYGLTRVLSYMIVPELNKNQLAIVLADYETEPLPIHVVYQQGRKATARVHFFIDFIVQKLRKANV